MLSAGLQLDFSDLESVCQETVALLEDAARWQGMVDTQWAALEAYMETGSESILHKLWCDVSGGRKHLKPNALEGSS